MSRCCSRSTPRTTGSSASRPTCRHASSRGRARRLLTRLDADSRRRLAAEIVQDHSEVGGGALPEVKLPTAALALGATPAAARALDEALRRADPPVIGRIARDRLLLD